MALTTENHNANRQGSFKISLSLNKSYNVICKLVHKSKPWLQLVDKLPPRLLSS